MRRLPLQRTTTAGMMRQGMLRSGTSSVFGAERKDRKERHSQGRSDASGPETCVCATALEYALITDKAMIPEKTKRDLEPIIGKYI